MSLVGRQSIPPRRLGIVFRNVGTGVVLQPEAVLRTRVPLGGGEVVPARGGRSGVGFVRGDTGAGDIEAGQIELCGRVALFGPRPELVDVTLGPGRGRDGDDERQSGEPDGECVAGRHVGSSPDGDRRGLEQTGAFLDRDRLVGIDGVERIHLAAGPGDTDGADGGRGPEPEGQRQLALRQIA